MSKSEEILICDDVELTWLFQFEFKSYKMLIL